MICVDYQVFMFCASKVDGVENEESMWKHSPKSKVASQVRLLLLPICVPSHNFFRNFFAKSFVVSNNICTFVATYSPRFPLEQRAQGESFLSFCHVQCLAIR